MLNDHLEMSRVMSPRPRKVSDQEIFAAAHRVMTRLGPAQWTLADIAAEAGLTAGALVQRFGSKHALQVELTTQVADATPELFAELRRAHPSPLEALRAYAGCFAQMGESPGALAHHLAYLQLDLTDPDLHRNVRAQASATRAAFRELLDEAVAAGELTRPVDTVALARAVEVALSGSLLTWAFYQDGPATGWVRTDLDAVLRPYYAPEADDSDDRKTRRPARGHSRSKAGHPGARSRKKRRP
jgi:AcrR family transcriptional regulator